MTFEFKISKEKNENYKYDYKLNEDFILYHNNEQHFHEYSSKENRLICYGYCFDVRNPKQATKETLEDIIFKNSFFNDVAYLNGQYILLYIKDGKLHVTIDATSLVPIYINDDFSIITNNKNEEVIKYFNPNLIIELNTRESQRISVDSINEDLVESILKLTKNQYKYFLSKNLVINFKSNNFMKALLAIMKPTLYNNVLTLSDSEEYENNLEFVDSIGKDFNMKVEIENENLDFEDIYFVRNLLFDYKQFTSKNSSNYKETKNIIFDSNFNRKSSRIKKAEANIISRKRDKSVLLNKRGILYDPFNVHAIYQLLMKNSELNVTGKLIRELLPSINYYNFTQKTTLKDINNDLVAEIKDLKRKQITASNEQFLMESKASYYNLSENIDGKIKNDEIIIYPASQEISNKEQFFVTYENPGDGMVLVKSFYKNKKNGQTIKVTIDGQDFTIDELYEGVLFNVKSTLNISMRYKISRNSLPWQKAGTLLIRQK